MNRAKSRLLTALIVSGVSLGTVVASVDALAQQRGEGRGTQSQTRDPADCQRDLQSARDAIKQQDMDRARQHIDQATRACCPDQVRQQDRVRTP